MDLRREISHLAFLAGVCALMFFIFLGKTPFHDKGEPREALVVRDIVLHGNWAMPLKYGEKIPSKPPLFHWVAAAASMIRGKMTESTIRFPSALFASLGAFLVYYFGVKLYGSETGLWAALILATSVVYQSAGVEARVDMTLTFFVALPLVLFYGIYQGFLGNGLWWFLFYLILGAGVTAKGPVSLVLCALIISVFLINKKRWDMLWKLLYHPGVVVGIVACSLWYGVAIYRGGEEFFALQFVKENLARFFVHGEGGTGHQKPIYYFIPYLFTLGLPWTIFLPLVGWFFLKGTSFHDDRALFLGIWVSVVFVFFSLSAGKRPPYILPLYPPLALLTAYCAKLAGQEPGPPAKGLQLAGWFSLVIGLTLVLIFFLHLLGWDLLAFSRLLRFRLKQSTEVELRIIQETLSSSGWLLYLFLSVSAALWLLLARNILRCNIKPAILQLVSVTMVGVLFIDGVITPKLAEARSYKAFVISAKEIVDDKGTLWVYPKGVDFSSVVFYGGDKVQALPESDRLVRQWLEQSKDYLVLRENEWLLLREDLSISFPVLLRSRGTGPDRDAPLVLVKGGQA